jgi:hypothetical protein
VSHVLGGKASDVTSDVDNVSEDARKCCFFSGFSWKNLARRTLTNAPPRDPLHLTALTRAGQINVFIILSPAAARPSLLESLAYLLRAERADAVEPETEDEMVLVA